MDLVGPMSISSLREGQPTRRELTSDAHRRELYFPTRRPLLSSAPHLVRKRPAKVAVITFRTVQLKVLVQNFTVQAHSPIPR